MNTNDSITCSFIEGLGRGRPLGKAETEIINAFINTCLPGKPPYLFTIFPDENPVQQALARTVSYTCPNTAAILSLRPTACEVMEHLWRR